MENNGKKEISDAFNMKTGQSVYQIVAIITRKDRVNGNTHVRINKGVVRNVLYHRYCLIFIISYQRLAESDQTECFSTGLNSKYSFFHGGADDGGK
jgi:hypothetical protein